MGAVFCSPTAAGRPKLYYTPTSCGAASFIAAHVAGVNLDVEQVELGTHKTTSGVDFYTINPKGNVPALVLPDGTLFNEGAATLQYIADLAPGKIAPLNGTIARYQVQQALNYTASELHVAIGGLFANHTPESKKFFLDLAAKKLTFANTHVIKKDQKFMVGSSFTIADAYLYIVLSWHPYVGIDLTPYPNVKAYFDGIKALPQVQAAHNRIALNPSTVF